MVAIAASIRRVGPRARLSISPLALPGDLGSGTMQAAADGGRSRHMLTRTWSLVPLRACPRQVKKQNSDNTDAEHGSRDWVQRPAHAARLQLAVRSRPRRRPPGWVCSARCPPSCHELPCLLSDKYRRTIVRALVAIRRRSATESADRILIRIHVPCGFSHDCTKGWINPALRSASVPQCAII